MKKFWLLGVLALLFPFQNCSSSGASSYAMLNSSSLQMINCTADPSSCLSTGAGNPNALTLRLSSWVTLNVSSTAPNIILTGICNGGGFARTRIYWQLVTSSGSVVTTSLLNGSQTGCVNGAFQETITGFVNSKGVAQFPVGTKLAVDLILNGINEQGSLVSPSTASQAAAVLPITITQ